jgi:hypothetical protein
MLAVSVEEGLQCERHLISLVGQSSRSKVSGMIDGD